MDTVKDAYGNPVQIYENRIDEELHNFYLKFAPDDVANDPMKFEQFIADSTQNRWNAALIHIQKTVFNDRKALKASIYFNTPNTPIKTNNNKYNYELLDIIADYLCYISMVYDKEISLNNFQRLTGIDRETMLNWNKTPDRGYSVTHEGFKIYQKLRNAGEDSLAAMLVNSNGKRNPVGVLGRGNTIYGWNMPGVRNETPKKQAVSAEQLPDFSNMHSSGKLLEDNSTAADP